MGPQKYIVILMCAISLSACQKDLELPEATKKINFSSQAITEALTDFSGFFELEEVDYSNNDIIEISPEAFKENKKLKYINLSGNPKLSLPESGPFLITTARTLNLSSCSINKIPGNSLDEMKMLEILDLTNNAIDFEDSLAFQNIEFPPKKMIVSEISETDLYFICKHVDMTVVVKQGEDKEYVCKDVRKDNGKLSKSQNIEMPSEEENVEITIIEEGLIKAGTHMEMEMSDQPDEGSGDGTYLISVPEVSQEKEDVTEEEQVVVSESTTTAEEAVDNVEMEVEESSEDEEIKPMIIDGTGAHDEILPKLSEERTEDSTLSPVVKPVGKGKSKARKPAPKEKVETSNEEDLPVETIAVDNIATVNKSGDIIKASEPAVGETVESSTSATSSVVLVLIIAVVVLGSALVGFKYYKNKKPSYAVVNGMPKDEPSEGKELKEIVTIKSESHPLMETQSDVQFEEVNEKAESKECSKPADNECVTNTSTDETKDAQDAPIQDNKSDTL